jgi:DNA-binding MarR family transcriptional regulator
MQDPNRRRRAVRFIIKSRTDRKKFLPQSLFSEPAWDMLLKIYAAAIEQQSVPILSLAKAAGVQSSTAVRWVAALEHQGLVTRERSNSAQAVSLSERGWLAMDSYFENMSSGQI